MIDLHNHILPGLDDGSRDLDESLEIARQFVSEGVTTVAATPHRNPSRKSGQSRETIEQEVARLQSRITEAGIELRVLPGHELYLTPEAFEPLDRGDVCTLGSSRALLVELPFDVRPLYLDDAIFRLHLAGYTVVLAHPERYSYLQRDLEPAESLAGRGVLLQVTAPSLLGEYGSRVRTTAEELVRRGLASLAGSDRHHPEQARSLAALHDRIMGLVDASTADLLLIENPARVLRDEPAVAPQAPAAPGPARKPGPGAH